MNKKLAQLLENNPLNILITRIDHIGDTLLCTPSVKALKSTFPHSKITVLASSFTLDVLRGNDDLDEIIVYESPEKIRSTQKIGLLNIQAADGEFYRKMKERNFDIIINFSAAVKDYKEAARFGGKFRIAPVYRKMLISRIISTFLLDHAVICDDDPGEYSNNPDSIQLLHEVEQNDKVVSFLGVQPVKTKLILPITPEDEDFAGNLLRNDLSIPEGSSIIAIQLSDRWFARDIIQQQLCILIDRIRREFPQNEIICFSYPGIENIVDEVRRLLFSELENSGSPEIKFVSDLPLKRFAAVLKQCSFILTMHSGATHISAAVGLPSVVVFNHEHFDYFAYRESPWNVNFIPIKKNFSEGDLKSAGTAKREKMMENHIAEIMQACREIEVGR